MSRAAIVWARVRASLACAIISVLCGSALAGSATYQYDGLGRLKSVTYADGTVITFNLDGAGNRTSVTSATLPAGALQFTAATYSGGEAAGQRSVTISVSRVNGSANSITVNYATEDGTAISASGDYTPASGQLSWIPGETASKSFTVNVLDDATYEGAQSFGIRLSGATGNATIGTPFLATINISDDENPPPGSLALSNSVYSATENGGNLTVSVTRTGGSYGAVSVQYANQGGGSAVSGTDFNVFSGTLNWADGDGASKTFVVPVLDDGVFDGAKTLNFGLSGASGASLASPSSATLSISDNEVAQPGTISLSQNTSYFANESAGSATITVVRSGGTDNAIDVSYSATAGSATAGADFTAVSGTLHWNNGESGSKTFSVPILEDDLLESSESVQLALTSITGGATGGTTSGTLTISDNETLGNITFLSANYPITEGASASVTLQVARQVNGTGAASVLLLNNGGVMTMLNWAAGELGTKTVVLPIGNDTFPNGTRTITISMSVISGAAYGAIPAATITITDDEPPVTVSINSPATVSEGGAITFTVGVNLRALDPITVSYASSSGTATQGSDFTGVAAQLTIPAQAWSTTVVVNTIDDAALESTTETFSVTLSNPSGANAALGTATGSGTIQDNESPTPSIPLNLRKTQTGQSPNFTVLWDLSTGAAGVNHYTLSEAGPAGAVTYTIPHPTSGTTASKAFSKGNGGERIFDYLVRACSTADESMCSGWSSPRRVWVCTGPNCNSGN
jgi:YD repeat-containing protein